MGKEEQIYIVKANGEREIFDREKLENSLRKAGASSLSIKSVLGVVNENLTDNMTTAEIYRSAFQVLKDIEGTDTSVKYSVRRAVMELGPDGFPFEDFVGAMFRSLGYKVQLRQSIKGLCVTHEVDVIAKSDDRLVLAEVKFHNKQGMKSDLKVVLYVKERSDDLRKSEFWRNCQLSKKEFWLITNTKFTSKATEYAECCSDLKLVSWNYPEGGSLYKIITDAKLYPLTCLESLNGYEKKLFLKKNIVLCRELKQGGERLFNLVGISSDKREATLLEIDKLLLKK